MSKAYARSNGIDIRISQATLHYYLFINELYS